MQLAWVLYRRARCKQQCDLPLSCEPAAQDSCTSCGGPVTLLCCAHLLPCLQPARLLARNGTCFKHYSIATSPCGNFVAASGSQGLVVLFRVVRSNPTGDQQQPAAARAGRKGQNLPWQLVHEATLLCVNARESMVNSVRFGQFAGVPRLLVSHQVRLLGCWGAETEVQTEIRH